MTDDDFARFTKYLWDHGVDKETKLYLKHHETPRTLADYLYSGPFGTIAKLSQYMRGELEDKP